MTELAVGDEDDDDVGAGERLLERDERDAVDRAAVQVRLDQHQVDLARGGERLGDVQGRALAQVVDVGLVGEPEARDLDPAAAFHGAAATTGVATPRPEVRIPAVPRRTPVPAPVDTTDEPVDIDEPATTEPAPAPSPPREPRVRREPAPAPARTLADEMRRMRPAQRALAAGDPVTALAELERYALEFPDGHLREEYLAMHAIARCDAGHAEGRREADEFLRARPLSLFAGRVRSACVTP